MTDRKSAYQYLPLQLSFLIFSMLLNCMGIVILKYSGSQITFQKLGILEFFKDIPIALVSLFCVDFISRLGSVKSLGFALWLVVIGCLLLPVLDDFWFFKIWFIIIGVSFAIAKISVFAIIKSNAGTEKQLSKIMSRVEASFMIGIFCVNMGFGWLLNSRFHEFWKFGFWLIALLSLFTLWKLMKSDYQEVSSGKMQRLSGLRKIMTPSNLLFFFILFLLVFTEQCFNSWLPTFYKKNLNVNSFYALQSSAFLALFSFLGRYLTSKFITRFQWLRYILFCLVTLMILMIVSQILVLNIKENLWILLFIFPILGLFIAPLYPLYNSRFLANIEKEKVNLMVSFIVIFSSMGSSVGSLGMSYVFALGADLYFMLFAMLPLLLILALTIIFSRKLILRQ